MGCAHGKRVGVEAAVEEPRAALLAPLVEALEEPSGSRTGATFTSGASGGSSSSASAPASPSPSISVSRLSPASLPDQESAAPLAPSPRLGTPMIAGAVAEPIELSESGHKSIYWTLRRYGEVREIKRKMFSIDEYYN